MKIGIKIALLLFIPVLANAQLHLPDSTTKALKNASNDSLRFIANFKAYNYFNETNKDSALFYADRMVLLAGKNNKELSMAMGLYRKGYQLTTMGRFAEALECLLHAFRISEDPKNDRKSWLQNQQSAFRVSEAPKNDNKSWLRNQQSESKNTRLLTLSATHHMFAVLMNNTQNTEQAIYHLKEERRIALEINNRQRVYLADMNLGNAYFEINKLDSALTFLNEAKKSIIQLKDKLYFGTILASFGEIALKQGDKSRALQFYYQGLSEALAQNNNTTLVNLYEKLSQFYLGEKERDSSLYYSAKMLKSLKTIGQYGRRQNNIGIAYENLYRSYQLRNQLDSAVKYAGLAVVAKDSIYNSRIVSLAKFQSLTLRDQFRLQNLEKEKVLYQSKVRTYALLGGLCIFLTIALILYRNNLQKHKANKVLEHTLINLKSTQTQLVQSEKMASLGELTAGIAHEIQNPLNFVNNFSEVSAELVDEMDEQLNEGDIAEAKAIGADLKQNLEKIRHHGKRADAIVKGMLQHSQSGNGVKELTNINALADEYLRLSYHGLRSKDNSFNAELVTSFDEKLPKVNVIPQDIGRVLLNLFNNAFYAVNQKIKTAGAEYKPTVTVSTSSGQGQLIIKVKDNGVGMPDSIKDKIMQPFFTTKPTGEGTGLGLSLTYDMVVKGHGGTIQVNSIEGEGSEFIIFIPIQV